MLETSLEEKDISWFILLAAKVLVFVPTLLEDVETLLGEGRKVILIHFDS